jgi:hypothetical protein
MTQMEDGRKAWCTKLLQLTSNQLHSCGHLQHQAPLVQDNWVFHKQSSSSLLSKRPEQQAQSHLLLITFAQLGINCRVLSHDELLSWHERIHMLLQAGRCSNELLPHAISYVFERGLKVISCDRCQA